MDYNVVFLEHDSQKELLALADKWFNRNISGSFPLREKCYMIISAKNPTFNQGTPAELYVHGLVYNAEWQYLIALVHLKNNFTDFIVPHIILAKKADLSDATIRNNLAGQIMSLNGHHTVKGIIDTMHISKEEMVQGEAPDKGGAPGAPDKGGAPGAPDKDTIYTGPRGGKYKMVNGKKKPLKPLKIA